MTQFLAFLYVVFIFALWVVGIFGWIVNIVKIFTTHPDTIWLIMRLVGIVVMPVGIVLGYL